MSIYIPYAPPPARDTLMAFQVIAGPQIGVQIEPDPMGPVNQIVTLMRGDRRVKSVLYPVPRVDPRMHVEIGRGGSNYHEMFSCPGWRALMGEPEDRRPAYWYIEVDGRRILEVPEHETWPPIPPPPPIPLWQRMRRAWTEQWRADVDRVMGRLGWHRDGACGGEDW